MNDLCERCHEPLDEDNREDCMTGLCEDCTANSCEVCEEDRSCCTCDPSEPEEGDWVTEDYITFREVGGKGVTRVPLDGPWQIAVKARMDQDQFWPNVWYRGERGNYELLNLEDE